MNRLFLLFVLLLSLTSCTSCEDLDFHSNSKLSASGILQDQNGNAIVNYPIEIRAVRGTDESWINYNSSNPIYSDEYINTTFTDENGYFQVFFPSTNWVEYMVVESSDSLEFIHENELIRSKYRILNFVDFNDDVGTLKLIQN